MIDVEVDIGDDIGRYSLNFKVVFHMWIIISLRFTFDTFNWKRATMIIGTDVEQNSWKI